MNQVAQRKQRGEISPSKDKNLKFTVKVLTSKVITLTPRDQIT